jgi:hypothetical protein
MNHTSDDNPAADVRCAGNREERIMAFAIVTLAVATIVLAVEIRWLAR